MNKLNKVVMGMSLLLLSSLGFGGAYTGSASIASVSSIIVNNSTYGTYFVIRGDWTHADVNCPHSQSTTWIVKDSNSSMDALKSMHDMVVAAELHSTTIGLYQDGCINDRPKAIRVYLPNN